MFPRSHNDAGLWLVHGALVPNEGMEIIQKLDRCSGLMGPRPVSPKSSTALIQKYEIFVGMEDKCW